MSWRLVVPALGDLDHPGAVVASADWTHQVSPRWAPWQPGPTLPGPSRAGTRPKTSIGSRRRRRRAGTLYPQLPDPRSTRRGRVSQRTRPCCADRRSIQHINSSPTQSVGELLELDRRPVIDSWSERVEVGGLEPPSHDVVPGLLRAQPPGESRTWVVRWHRIQAPARFNVPERERAPRPGGACYRRPIRSRRQRAEDGYLSEVRQRARSCSWRL